MKELLNVSRVAKKKKYTMKIMHYVTEVLVSIPLRIKCSHVLKNAVCRKIDWEKFVQEYFLHP